MAEEQCADRAGDHGGAEDGEGSEQRGGLVTGGKEQVRKDQHGGRGIDVEVVELDGRADEARHDDAALRIQRRGRRRN
jgi:hypothetical protein